MPMKIKWCIHKHNQGFTLLEILIALFVFTILSTILVGALRNVMDVQVSTEQNADRLRHLQMTLLVMSRDIEQTLDRPVLDATGKEEQSFIGTPTSFRFTHAGFANPMGKLAHSTLQRTGYSWSNGVLSRATWLSLDQAPDAVPLTRSILDQVDEAHFQYLANDNKFYDNWPIEEQQDETLPRAVRIYLTIAKWGTISQLYVISAQSNKAASTQTPAPPGQQPASPPPNSQP